MTGLRHITVLCEGSSDAAFIRRFLAKRGFDAKKVTVCEYPAGEGCGEKFVCTRYPQELKELRRWKNRGLIVMSDADTKSTADRKRELNAACDAAGVPARKPGEPVLLAIPKRNSETWYKHLHGAAASECEGKEFKKSDNHDFARAAADRLDAWCFERQRLPAPTLPSLLDVCEEWREFARD